MNEELIYKEIINPELLQSMEIEVEIHKLKNNEINSFELPIKFVSNYHQSTGDFLDDLYLGRQSERIREYYVKDYTRGGKDRAEFEDVNISMWEKSKNVSGDVKGKLSQSVSAFGETIKGVFNMGKEFLNS
jgi:hypothetical protein